jgi:hypothetical protein
MFTPHIFTLNREFNLLNRASHREFIEMLRPDIVEYADNYSELMRWIGDQHLGHVWYYPPRKVEKMDGTSYVNAIVSSWDDNIAVEFKLRFSEFIESYEFVIDTEDQT